MITVSSTIRNLLKTKHRQVVRITVGNTGLTLTGEHIAQDGLSIDRYCASGSILELGSAISSELTLKLLNFDGSFDNVTFEGQELKVEQGVVDSGNTYWFDMGYFKVDTPPRKKSTISITALDRMVKFDESAYAWSATQTYPMTVAQMVSAVCQRCYVTLATNLSNLPNANVSIPKDPVTSEEITFRNIIQWASAMMGTCAYINESGQLVFGWIANTDINITPEYRYQGADLWEGNVTITGYTFSTTIETETEDDVNTEDVTYYSGTLEYPIDLSANPLVASAPQTILDALYSAIGTITYRPFECTTIPFPYIMPLDRITYTDPNGNEISTLVTNVVHNLNLGSAIAGKGDTETTKGYSTGTGFTPSQTKELTKTQILIEQASAAATSAQASADSAHASAVSANNSANSALVQLSVVEDVAGTLNWIREHGSFVQTTDTTVHETTVYFELINGEYVPIAQPDPTKNPSEEGWYVLDVTDSQSEYIMAHLAVTSAGLWVLPFTPLAPHPLVDSADNDLIDSDNNQLVDWSRDPQNANGYKVLLASDGMSIYDSTGDSVAFYGETTRIGKEYDYNVHITSNEVQIRNGTTVLAKYGATTKFYEPDGVTEAAEIGANGMHVKSGLVGGWDINANSLSRTAVPISTSHFESGTITLDSLGMDIHGVYPSGGDFTTSDLDINPEYIRFTTYDGNTKYYETEMSQSAIRVVTLPDTAYSSYTVIGAGSVSASDYIMSNIVRADSNHDLQLYANFNTACVRVTQYGNFRPEGVGTQSLGTSNNPWKDVWANDTSINTSDRKFKDNVEDITFSEDLIMNLKPVTYMWKDGDHRRKRMGFVAQDVADVCENIGENLSVVTASYSDGSEYHGEKADDKNLRWGMSYEQLIAPMVCEIQKLMKRVDELETKIKEMGE